MPPTVVAVCSSAEHSFAKQRQTEIDLRAGLGVAGDAHSGRTVQHLSRIARDPTQANLRQVHLIHAELFDELAARGFVVRPGELGENITTAGVDLIALPLGARLHIGASALVEVTGLRNPCSQIDDFQRGLMRAVLDRDAEGRLVRKTGVMGVVLADGIVRPGDAIRIEMPPAPHRALEIV